MQAKGQATPKNVQDVRAIIYWTKALNESITVMPPKGEKPHVWLSKAQVSNLYLFCSGDSMKDFRNRVVLALMVGAGVQREELVNLIEDLPQQPRWRFVSHCFEHSNCYLLGQIQSKRDAIYINLGWSISLHAVQ